MLWGSNICNYVTALRTHWHFQLRLGSNEWNDADIMHITSPRLTHFECKYKLLTKREALPVISHSSRSSCNQSTQKSDWCSLAMTVPLTECFWLAYLITKAINKAPCVVGRKTRSFTSGQPNPLIHKYGPLHSLWCLKHCDLNCKLGPCKLQYTHHLRPHWDPAAGGNYQQICSGYMS